MGEHDPSTGLGEVIANARNSGLEDAVLIADGTEFPVHTQILSLVCPFFKTFFTTPLNRNGDSTLKEVPIDREPDVLEKILQFIYGEKKNQEFDSYELAKNVLATANEWLLPKYEEVCAKYLITFLKDETFLELYNSGVLFKNNIILKEIRKKLGLKYHPNEAIQKFHNFIGTKVNQEFPMENIIGDIKEIKWENVDLENINLIIENEYLEKDTIIKIQLERASIIESKLAGMKRASSAEETLKSKVRKRLEDQPLAQNLSPEDRNHPHFRHHRIKMILHGEFLNDIAKNISDSLENEDLEYF